MSWSINVIGIPGKINEVLDAESIRLTDQSKQEFDIALPALKTLVSQNVGASIAIKLVASGHATFNDGVATYSNCMVSIEPSHAKIAF